MYRFFGQRTCTLDMNEYLPGTYNEITHTTIATMLAEEDYLTKTRTIQISTCHRFASICFTERQILDKFCQTELEYLLKTYQLNSLIRKLKPSDQNIQLSFEKKYFPGIKHNNKHSTTGIQI